MKIYSFKNDYSEGAHPSILNKLVEINLEQTDTYGLDPYSERARSLIKKEINNQNAEVHFVTGGTMANLLVLSSMLRPYESVIAPVSGHIATHETGAIEATGHKINTVETSNGKLTPQDIQNIVEEHTDEHMVKPRCVYISNSTEMGTVYKKSELEALCKKCKELNLYLFMDGARLASAITSKQTDLTMGDIASLVDVFYIGGTKNGALLGEAIVIVNKNLQDNFRYVLKQRGALLAKGRLLGVQFLELFSNNLFYELGSHGNKMAEKMAIGIGELGYNFASVTESNQLFPILLNKVIERLGEYFDFYIWEKYNNESSVIRLVTSWTTTEDVIEKFVSTLSKVSL